MRQEHNEQVKNQASLEVCLARAYSILAIADSFPEKEDLTPDKEAERRNLHKVPLIYCAAESFCIFVSHAWWILFGLPSVQC